MEDDEGSATKQRPKSLRQRFFGGGNRKSGGGGRAGSKRDLIEGTRNSRESDMEARGESHDQVPPVKSDSLPKFDTSHHEGGASPRGSFMGNVANAIRRNSSLKDVMGSSRNLGAASPAALTVSAKSVALKGEEEKLDEGGARAQPGKLKGKLPWMKEENAASKPALPPFLTSKAKQPSRKFAPSAIRRMSFSTKKADGGEAKPLSVSPPPAVIKSSDKMEDMRSRPKSMGMALKKTDEPSLTSKSRSKSVGKYKTTANSVGADLTLHEQAFMPGDLLKRLGESAGQLPPAPSVFSGHGAVLFVDVSGFTRLAENLNKENVPVKAGEKLAATITRVLEVLALVCLNCGGEVGKFAGDALLCVWEMKDMDKAEILARNCAVQMLEQMEHLNRIERTELQIHGGVAKGSIVHFHFGSSDDDLRWYLISGEAAAAATQLVDVARAGEFCCQEGVAKGLPSIQDENSADEDIGGGLFSGRGGAAAADEANRKTNGGTIKKNIFAGVNDSTGKRKTISRGTKTIPTLILTSSSKIKDVPTVPLDAHAAVLKDGLPRNCNVYIPRLLRNQLNERSKRSGEMRRRIAVIFVEISTLNMTEEELLKQGVDDKKLDELNTAFVSMTRIVHTFEGEVRDMLFDDKGCVYIATFGAHEEEENEHYPWNLHAVKSAIAIINEIPAARVGVSMGTCFVGMCGVLERRTDFVVVGHEVNMAARYMAKAKAGQVIVSSGIYGSTRETIKYGPEVTIMVGKGEYAKPRTVYSPLEENGRRTSFVAKYRKSISSGGTFVGRKAELALIEQTLTKISQGRSGVIVVDSLPGRGKSALVGRAKKMGKGKIKVVTGTAKINERGSPYYAFRQVLEAYTGLRPSMNAQETRDVIQKLENKGERINIVALSHILPWIHDASRPGETGGVAANAIGVDQVCDTVLKIIKFTLDNGKEPCTLICLEDVQFMDSMSLEMLIKLFDGSDKIQRLALLLTFRSDTPPLAGPAGKVFDALEDAMSTMPEGFPKTTTTEIQRRELVQSVRAKARKFKFNSAWIDLQAFDKAETGVLAGRLLGDDLIESSITKVFDATKGEPLHTEMLMDWLQDSSSVKPEPNATVSISCEAKSLPQSLDDLIMSKFSKLSEEAKRVIQLAASGGEVFDPQYVFDASKSMATAEGRANDALKKDAIMSGLSDAEDLNLLAGLQDASNDNESLRRWRFKHEMIQRCIWVKMPLPKREIIDRAALGDRKSFALRLKST